MSPRKSLVSVTKFTLITILLGLWGSGCPNPEVHGSLYENAGAAFATCNTSEIKHLADSHEMMGAFKYCGSNHFKSYAWSPTGELLYFDLPLTANIMNAAESNKPLYKLPIENPTGQVAWINQNRIAYPLAAKKDDEAKLARIGLFDTFAHTIDNRSGNNNSTATRSCYTRTYTASNDDLH